MIKCIALIRKKDSVTPEFFRDYYETKHAPFILGLLPGIASYQRNYVTADDTFLVDRNPPDFDVITELTFASDADFQAFVAKSGEPETRAAIADDESHFLDSAATRMFQVDLRASPR